MYLTRLSLLERPDLSQTLKLLGDTYKEHQMLWQLFDAAPDAQRDFLYRRELRHGRLHYYILSARKPINDLGIWHIDPPKPFTPKLATGQKLAFSLRANPTITRNGRRHDIVMDLKRRTGWQQMPPAKRPSLAELIQQAGIEWLQARALRHGFSFQPEQVSVEGYQQHHLHRGKQIRFSTLDYMGLLTVTDPETFLQTLKRGIGPAKAFGCGLMLIKRA